MLRYQRFVSRFVAASLFLFACGLIGSTILTRSTSLEIDSSELTLSNFPVGQVRELSFNVHNPSYFGAAQIVGIRGGCSLGCVEAVAFQSFQLEPGESKRLIVQFKSPKTPGPIEVDFSLYYTSNNRTRRQELCIRGNAVENENH